jgi:hypothetical protein
VPGIHLLTAVGKLIKTSRKDILSREAAKNPNQTQINLEKSLGGLRCPLAARRCVEGAARHSWQSLEIFICGNRAHNLSGQEQTSANPASWCFENQAKYAQLPHVFLSAGRKPRTGNAIGEFAST